MELHREAVSPELSQVLEILGEWPELSGFRLVGGTALAFYLGHRRSVDIDLFTHTAFDPEPIADRLARELVAAKMEMGKNLVRCVVRDIKVDVLAHQYPILEPATDMGGLRLASLPDIAAMKLNAIMRRGAKKDFWDIAALLDRYPMAIQFEFFSRKYGDMNRFALAKSLCYFSDADSESAPILTLTGMTWPAVKARIQAATNEMLRDGRPK
jgi:predicted nucleotidyltransferase component of viral defense system